MELCIYKSVRARNKVWEAMEDSDTDEYSVPRAGQMDWSGGAPEDVDTSTDDETDDSGEEYSQDRRKRQREETVREAILREFHTWHQRRRGA